MAPVLISRLILVYVIQPVIVTFFIFLAVKILKRSNSRLSKIFSSFYIITAISNILNMIYAPLDNEIIIIILNFFTNFCVFFSYIFILISNMIIISSSVIYTVKKQNQLIMIYGGLLLGMVVFLPFGGVTVNPADNFPVWNLPFFVYVMLVFTIVAFGPVINTSLKIYKSFNNKILKKRWSYFIIGLLGLTIVLYSIMINNFLNIPEVRTIISIISLSVMLWVFLLYYGIGRQLKE